MKIEDTVAFVTGANRGLGRALVDALLERGARRVYAASRDGKAHHSDRRVVSTHLDVTNVTQARAAAAAASDTRILINNAGSLASFSVLAGDPEQLRRDLEVNAFGTLAVTNAFAPTLVANPGSAVVNVLSVVSLASMPALGGYSASKAAAWSLTQSLRGDLAPKGVRVHAVFPGPIDTDMIRSFEMPKTSPDAVARAILDGVVAGQDDIAPDPMSQDVLAAFQRDPRSIERRFAG